MALVAVIARGTAGLLPPLKQAAPLAGMLALLSALSACSLAPLHRQASCGSGPAFDLEASLEENVDAFVRACLQGGEAPGVAVLVAEGGMVKLKKGYGLADLDKQLPVTPNTPFYLASVSKPLTAVAVMMLVERGLLDYDDRLIDFFPEAPAAWRAITVHHLLTHQSGLPGYFGLAHRYRQQVEGITNQHVLELLIRHGRLLFEPGARYSYSNSGYVLLALLVERVSGRPFDSFVKENIFAPLGMEASFVWGGSKGETPGRAIGYGRDSARHDVYTRTWGDAGIFSTVEDLYTWEQRLYTGELIGRETLRRAFAAHAEAGEDLSYAYGWYVGPYRGLTSCFHGGRLAGFSARISRIPERLLTVIILSNGTYGAWVHDLNDAILAYYLP